MANKFKNTRVQTVTADSFLVNPEKLHSCPDRTLEQGLREIKRELWVRKWYERAQLYKTHNKTSIAFHGSYTTVAIIGNDQIAPHMGWAKCSSTDRYDDRVGVAVATARAFEAPIPDYI